MLSNYDLVMKPVFYVRTRRSWKAKAMCLLSARLERLGWED